LEHTKTLKTFEATTVVDDADQLFAALKIRLKEVG
ncbi:MAG TPA: flavoprotein, partial [Methylophaga sp.]|nr:flavoprotein [Methylophaga sp.]